MALRGTAAHRVIEQLAGRPHTPPQQLREAFLGALAIAAAATGAPPLIRLAAKQMGVNALFPADQQASTCRFIRKVLERQVPGPAARPVPLAFPASGARSFAFGRERKLVSSALDMEGWVDLVYKDSSGTVHVCDFKTGNVFDADGQPKRAYLLQISAYGLLAKDMLGLQEVALELVGPASEWHETLDGRLTAMAKDAVATLNTRLPKLEPVHGESLAAPGSWCKSCMVRPSCPVYMRALEGARAAEEILSPFDLAGTVAEIFAGGEFVRLRILAHNGKRVSLSGVPASIYPELAPGLKILGFSLGSFDVLARAAFPANFYIFRPDDPKASAFGSQLRISSSPRSAHLKMSGI
jgi:hypothetical protein